MIDENKLIKDVEYYISHTNETSGEHYAYIRCKQLVERQPKVGEWIPVSERLPEDERECLVTLEKVHGTPKHFFGIANYLKFGDAGYWNENKYGYLEWDKYSDGHG